MYSMIPGWSPQVGGLKVFNKLDAKIPENLVQNNDYMMPSEDLKQQKASPLKKPAYFSSNQGLTDLGKI